MLPPEIFMVPPSTLTTELDDDVTFMPLMTPFLRLKVPLSVIIVVPPATWLPSIVILPSKVSVASLFIVIMPLIGVPSLLPTLVMVQSPLDWSTTSFPAGTVRGAFNLMFFSMTTGLPSTAAWLIASCRVRASLLSLILSSFASIDATVNMTCTPSANVPSGMDTSSLLALIVTFLRDVQPLNAVADICSIPEPIVTVSSLSLFWKALSLISVTPLPIVRSFIALVPAL